MRLSLVIDLLSGLRQCVQVRCSSRSRLSRKSSCIGMFPVWPTPPTPPATPRRDLRACVNACAQKSAWRSHAGAPAWRGPPGHVTVAACPGSGDLEPAADKRHLCQDVEFPRRQGRARHRAGNGRAGRPAMSSSRPRRSPRAPAARRPCLSGSHVGADPAAMRTRARRDSDVYVLHGCRRRPPMAVTRTTTS